MVSPIDISNRALAQCGSRSQIANFNEGSVEAINCNLLYQPTFEQLGRAAHWGCLRAQTSLTLLKAAQGTPQNQNGTVLPLPPQPWLYEYALPTDCLFVRYVQPTFIQPAGSVPIFPTPSSLAPYVWQRGAIPFVVSTDLDSTGNRIKVILTNLSTAQVIYTVNEPNPDFWESQFQAAYVASLAAFLIPPLNLNMGLLSMQTKIADAIIAEARSADGNEGVISQNREADWILARGCGQWLDGTGYGAGYGAGGCEYINMSWPC